LSMMTCAGILPSLKSLTSCPNNFSTLCLESGKPIKGRVFSSQYLAKAFAFSGPTTRITVFSASNFAKSRRNCAMCARQYGQRKPRLKTSRTLLVERKPDKVTVVPLKSSSVKSGAGVLISILAICIYPYIEFQVQVLRPFS